MEQAFTQIADKLRRAARNQERLHLDFDLVMALLTSPIYATIAQLESEELAQSWQEHSASGLSGSHGEPTAKNGQSAGTTAPLEPAAASQLALAATTMAIRRGKQSRSLSTTTGTMAKRKPSIPDPRKVSA